MEHFHGLLRKYALDAESFSVEGIGRSEEKNKPEPQKYFVPFQLSENFDKKVPEAALALCEKDQDDEVVDLFENDQDDWLRSESETPFWENKF